MNPLISIIIVTYNSERFIYKLLNSLNTLKYKNFEVIIIDNGSRDKTCEIINQFKDKYKLILINSEKNLGFGKANNLAAKQAKGKYLFFLNPDTEILDDRMFDKLVSKMESNPKLGILSPLYYTEKEKRTQPKFVYIYNNAFMKQVPMNEYVDRIYSKRFVQNLPDDEELIYTDGVLGAHLMIRKEIFDRLNGFDERFFFYSEETDLCLRVWKLNYAVAWYKDSYIYHFVGGCGFGSFQTKNGVKSRLQFIYKWNDRFEMFWVILFAFGAIIKRIFQFRFNELPDALDGLAEGFASLNEFK